MTKNKETALLEIDCDVHYYGTTARNRVGEVIDEYAKSQAIAFAEWVDVNAVRNGFHEWTTGVGSSTKRHNSEELYNLFLQSQQS